MCESNDMVDTLYAPLPYDEARGPDAKVLTAVEEPFDICFNDAKLSVRALALLNKKFEPYESRTKLGVASTRQVEAPHLWINRGVFADVLPTQAQESYLAALEKDCLGMFASSFPIFPELTEILPVAPLRRCPSLVGLDATELRDDGLKVPLPMPGTPLPAAEVKAEEERKPLAEPEPAELPADEPAEAEAEAEAPATVPMEDLVIVMPKRKRGRPSKRQLAMEAAAGQLKQQARDNKYDSIERTLRGNDPADRLAVLLVKAFDKGLQLKSMAHLPQPESL